MTRRSSATEGSTAVRCPIGRSVVSLPIRSVMLTVVSLVETPAPYVMETKLGRSDSSSRSACQSVRSPSGVFGGKNSNENVGSPVASRSRIERLVMSWKANRNRDAYPRDMTAGPLDRDDLRERVDKALA